MTGIFKSISLFWVLNDFESYNWEWERLDFLQKKISWPLRIGFSPDTDEILVILIKIYM